MSISEEFKTPYKSKYCIAVRPMKVRMKPEDLDKYKDYAVDFHGNVPHTDDEVEEGDSKLDDWHTRHKDKNLDVFCDSHPSAPQCKVFDD